jgi:hypothetical protein
MSLISAGSISLDRVPLRMFSINILSKFLGAKLHARGYVTHPAPCGDIRGGLSRVSRHPGQHPAAGLQSSLTHPGYPPQSRQSAKLFLQTLDWGLPHHRNCPQASVFSLPLVQGGGTDSLAGEGVEGVPIPTRGHTWYSRFIGMYSVFPHPSLDIHSSVLDVSSFLLR